MSSNNIDKHIAEKLKNRELKPSNSAWERLENRLDSQEVAKKRNRFLYVGYAAGLALLISFGIFYFTGSNSKMPIKEVIVDTPIDTSEFNNQEVEQLIRNTDEAVVKVEESKEKKQLQKNKVTVTVAKESIFNKEEMFVNNIQNEKPPKKEVVADLNRFVIKKKEPTSRIKVNSDDLLFAVTHSPEEIKEYYATHKLKREDVLKTIEEELKKSNLKIDPNIILAEVERSIDDEEFSGDFMQKLTSRISDIALAIVDRNK